MLSALLYLHEFGSLEDAQTNVEADRDQHDADQERDSPAPCHEIGFGQRREECDEPGGEAETDRQPDLGNAREEAAFFRRRIFERHQHCTAPFSAEADALQDAHQQQQNRSPDADLGVGGKEPDQEGGNAHDHERQHQHAFAPDAVAEMTEQHAAERPRHESDGERRIRQKGRNQWIGGREIQLVEHDPRNDAVKEEVIPLDGGSEQAGNDHPAQVCVLNIAEGHIFSVAGQELG